MFENESGYHTDQVEETYEAAVEPTEEYEAAPEQVETTDHEESSPFLTVKYNKEERALTQEEAQAFAQKGMNYDKINERLEQMNSYNERLARMSGYQTVDEMFDAIEEAEKLHRQEQFEQYGLDEETFTQLVENSPLAEDLKFAREIKQQQAHQDQLRKQIDEFVEMFPDVQKEDIADEVWIAAESGQHSLIDAYLRHNYKSMHQAAEQAAIQKLQQTGNASPGSLNAGATEQKLSVKDMSQADFDALIRRVEMGEKIIL